MFAWTVKTDKLAENHFKRVTSFAKEMLVWPTEIDVHKIKNAAYTSEVKPSSMIPPINIGHVKNAHSVEISARSGAAASSSVRVQPPMKFGSFQTGTERLAESIMQS